MLQHLQINGFGRLRGAHTLRPGVNAFTAPGPAGKSAFAALLFYLFYPESPAARALCPDLRPLNAYAPWDNADFSASATLELPPDNRKINLWRDFAAGRWIILNAADGRDITAEFAAPGRAPGETLFGLTAEEFAVLAFIAPSAIPPAGAFAPFARRIADGARRRDPARAHRLLQIDRARAALDQRPGAAAGIAEETAEAETAREAARAELAALEAAHDRAEDAYAAALTAWEKLADMRAELDRHEYLAAEARLRGLDAQEADAAAARAEFRALQTEAETLSYAAGADFSDADTVNAQLRELPAVLAAARQSAEAADAARAEHENCEQRLRAGGSATAATRGELENAEAAAAALGEILNKENALRLDCRRAAAAWQKHGVSRDDAENLSRWLDAGETAGVSPDAGKGPAPENPAESGAGDFPENPETEDLWRLLPARDAMAAKLEECRKKREANDEHAAMLQKINARDTHAACRHLGLALTLLTLGGTACALLGAGIYSAVPAAACAAWAGYGIHRLRRARAFNRRMGAGLADLGRQITAETAAVARAAEARAAALATRAAALGTTPENLTRVLETTAPARDGIDSWRRLRARLRELEERAAAARAECCGVLAGYGITPEAFDLGKARFYLAEIRKTLDLRERAVTAWNRAETLRAEAETARAALTGKQQTTARRIAAALGLNPEAAGGGAPEEFQENLERLAERYRQTGAAQARLRAIRDRLLPDAARAVDALPSAEVLANNRAHYQSRMAELAAARPELADLPTDDDAAAHEAAMAELREEISAGEAAVKEPEAAYMLVFTARAEQAPGLRDAAARAEAKLQEIATYRENAQKALTQAEAELAAADNAWPAALAAALNQTLADGGGPRPWTFAASTELALSARRPGAAEAPEESFADIFSRGERELLYWHWRLTLNRELAARAEETPAAGLIPWFLVADEPLAAAGGETLTAARAALAASGRQAFVFSRQSGRWADDETVIP